MGAKQQTQQRPMTSTPSAPGRTRGTIRHVYPERGFGFIRCTEGAPDDVGQDFFFHISGLEDGLRIEELLPGTPVVFESTEVPRGKRAEHVRAE